MCISSSPHFKAIAHLAEKASIDEAFIDLTPVVLDMLRSRHTQLQFKDGNLAVHQPLPPAPPIEDPEQWQVWQAIQAQHNGTTFSQDCTWQDWALLYGAEIMLDMRKAVQDRLGFTCSAVNPGL